MTKTTTTIWDPATHLATGDDVAAYLESALQDGDPQLVAAALGDIARAKGMSQVARDAGLGRDSYLAAGSAPRAGSRSGGEHHPVDEVTQLAF